MIPTDCDTNDWPHGYYEVTIGDGNCRQRCRTSVGDKTMRGLLELVKMVGRYFVIAGCTIFTLIVFFTVVAEIILGLQLIGLWGELK